ncbi:MAG: hypothetical protein R2710_24890 [Acidimicrobiales bacterium]
MNLFRSEEHARRWVGFDEAMASSLKPVTEWASIFSNPIFRERGRADYISWTRSDDGVVAFANLRASLPQRSEG